LEAIRVRVRPIAAVDRTAFGRLLFLCRRGGRHPPDGQSNSESEKPWRETSFHGFTPGACAYHAWHIEIGPTPAQPVAALDAWHANAGDYISTTGAAAFSARSNRLRVSAKSMWCLAIRR